MGEHIINGEFQSDKYPTCPPGKVPLSTEDPMAQDLLWAYAQRRVVVDPEFGKDLVEALEAKGYVHGGGVEVVSKLLEFAGAVHDWVWEGQQDHNDPSVGAIAPSGQFCIICQGDGLTRPDDAIQHHAEGCPFLIAQWVLQAYHVIKIPIDSGSKGWAIGDRLGLYDGERPGPPYIEGAP